MRLAKVVPGYDFDVLRRQVENLLPPVVPELLGLEEEVLGVRLV
jgi:hypothetical protein